MADSTKPTAAAAVAAATNFAELEALSNPKIPTGVVRSKYMIKFHLLDKMDVRRLEINKKNSNILSHVCSFCNICFNLTWRMFGVDGKGTYDKPKVLCHLKQSSLAEEKIARKSYILLQKKLQVKSGRQNFCPRI